MGSIQSLSDDYLATTARYTDPSWLDNQETGRVKVWSRRITSGMGVHHAIVVDCVPDGKWRVFEWGVGNHRSGYSAYAC